MRYAVVGMLGLLGLWSAGGLAGCDRGTPAPAPSESRTEATETSSPPAPPWFVDEARERGVDFTWRSGHDSRFLMPEITGGGAALFDMDDDGDLDLYLVQGGRLDVAAADENRNRLYRNRGDGYFDDVTSGSGADDRGYGMGVACGDYDGDGDADLYVTNVGDNTLLRNDGNGVFTDVTSEAGVGDPAWGTSAAFVDLDGDGHLDLYATNYLNWSVATELTCYNAQGLPDYCAPASYQAPSVDVAYLNDGDGTFTDVTAALGFEAASGTGLGVVTGDFTGNGRDDVFVANDGMPDRLWERQSDGTFRNVALTWSCGLDEEGKAKAGMGVAAADIDQDGDLDLIVCNLDREADSFFRNDGRFFTDATRTAGLGRTSKLFTRFGMGWIDFDNDGWLDLFQANGRVANRSGHPDPADPFAEANLLYRGAAGPAFEEVTPRGGAWPVLVATSRGAAFGDVDNDGGMDIVVVNRDAPVNLLRNVVADRGHWITFRVKDEAGRDDLNARVTVKTGDRTISRQVRAAYSYLTSNDPRAHFGLGDATSVDEVVVEWSDGAVTQHGPFAVDTIVVIIKPTANGELPTGAHATDD